MTTLRVYDDSTIPGARYGYTHFDAALRDPFPSELLDRFESREVIPSLDANAPVNLTEYPGTVRSRFLNAYIADSMERIAMDGVSKFPAFVVPAVRACFDKEFEPIRAMSAIAPDVGARA